MHFNVQCCTFAIFADLTQKWRRSSSSFSWNGTTSSQTWSHPSSTCVTRRASQTWPWPATARLAKHTKWSCLLVVPTSNRYLRCENTPKPPGTHTNLMRALLHLQENPSKHPIIILKDVPFSHLQAILEFMYAGEVNVSQDQLPAFLKTAERLKVKGLAEAPQSIKREH